MRVRIRSPRARCARLSIPRARSHAPIPPTMNSSSCMSSAPRKRFRASLMLMRKARTRLGPTALPMSTSSLHLQPCQKGFCLPRICRVLSRSPQRTIRSPSGSTPRTARIPPDLHGSAVPSCHNGNRHIQQSRLDDRARARSALWDDFGPHLLEPSSTSRIRFAITTTVELLHHAAHYAHALMIRCRT